MFSIPHLIIVFVVALVVFGPEKLPELARNFGKLMGEFRRATGDLRSTFEGHLTGPRARGRPAAHRWRNNKPSRFNTRPNFHSNAEYSGSPAAAEAEISTALGAAGTVPTTPPHLGIGTPVSEPASVETAVEQSAPSEPASEPTASTVCSTRPRSTLSTILSH